MSLHQNTKLLLVQHKKAALFHTGHLATAIWNWYASDSNFLEMGVVAAKAISWQFANMPSICHHPAVTMPSSPCHGLETSLTERHISGMACVNQTRPHCVNQMGKTQSNDLAERHGRGTAWERHGMSESALTKRCRRQLRPSQTCSQQFTFAFITCVCATNHLSA
jgi:hypothetical protein